MSMSSTYLTRPSRRSSTASSSASASASKEQRHAQHDQRQQQQQPQQDGHKPYEPVFQPPGYAYKIALPARPAPGQTPWPAHLPPVVSAPARDSTVAAGPPFGNVTNHHHRAHSTAAPVYQQQQSLQQQQYTRTRSVSTVAPSALPAQWTHGLNPLLVAGPLLWTLKLPPTYIKLRPSALSTPGPLTYTHRAQPASSTPSALTAIIVSPSTGWKMSVAPGATLGDVLDALHAFLYAPLTPSEWASADQHTAARAWRVRCATDAAEAARGVRRVDALGVGAAFAGLVRAQTEGEWVLRVVVA